MSTILYEDFTKVEIRVGQIIKADLFPKARKPAYKLWLDFGEKIGIKKTSAQITALYDVNELVGKKVIAVTNFPAKQIADFMSEVLILGVETEEGDVSLLKVEHDVPLGSRVF